MSSRGKTALKQTARFISSLAEGNKAFRELKYEAAIVHYKQALQTSPEIRKTIEFNISLVEKRKHAFGKSEDRPSNAPTPPLIEQATKMAVATTQKFMQRKLPITVLVITWDVGHNPLGRSYMLAEVLERVARKVVIIGFQFPKYGSDVWEPVREAKLPVISLPGTNFPEFLNSLDAIAKRIKPDIVIACKPRFPSVQLGLLIKERYGCPLIVDIDDHELSFFKTQTELSLETFEAMPPACAAEKLEPYGELWTRLTQYLCRFADEKLTSNLALHREFGGTIVPHVRDEVAFNPALYNRNISRNKYGVPMKDRVALFFGTPRHHKGIDALASAVGQIDDEYFRLVIVGSPPDRTVTAKLDALAPGRVIYLPNQPFSAIPEILSMADVVCLPQDEDNAISQYQLPAKAIDAVAMGIPLLVTRTLPLMQLVEDGVAIPVEKDKIVEALKNIAYDKPELDRWRAKVRPQFLARYSYYSAAQQLREILQRTLHRRNTGRTFELQRTVQSCKRALGLPKGLPTQPRTGGIDVVLFWKQNDTGIYGRRHDMVIKYLSSRKDVRKVVVFDAPISEFDLIKRRQSNEVLTQDRWIYVRTYEKLLGKHDTEKITYNVFMHSPGKYRTSDDGSSRPHLLEGYIPYLQEVFQREGVRVNEAIFWVYPKNYFSPAIIDHFNPPKVVVDVVDDHRTWPGVSEQEIICLTDNYREILARADMAFVNCEPMRESMKEFFPDIIVIPNGCDTDLPKVEPRNSPDYEAFKSFTGKTIGFVGNLEAKIDIELIKKVARRFKSCQVVLLGSTHANPAARMLREHANVRMPGVVPYEQIGAWLNKFDVGIVPHINMPLTQNMNPLKVYVYLADRVPIVSTEIPNIDRSNSLINVAKNHDQFLDMIKNVLVGKNILDSELNEFININSWKNRFCSKIDFLLGTDHLNFS